MQRTQGVFIGLASLALVFAIGVRTPLAQQDGPAAQGAPPSQQAPSPSTPSAPGPSSGALGQSQAAATATGELTDVDSKTKTLTVKTAAGSEMKFKYDDSTKVSGAGKTTAGLATMTGQQVTIQYKKDGQSNIVTNIEVQSGAGPSPSAPRSPGAPAPGP